VTFDTPFAALLTVFQLFTTSNWHQVMYAAMEATTAWASIYFISFYFLVIASSSAAAGAHHRVVLDGDGEL
jgi:hypothetical protein